MSTSSSSASHKVLSAIHNLPRRMKSRQFRDPPRPRTRGKENGGKENAPHSGGRNNPAPAPVSPLELAKRWAPRDGQIIVKVAVPSTDDIWKMRVPEDVSFASFRVRVEEKIGFSVVFASEQTRGRRAVSTEKDFRRWVRGRVKGGRNVPITAHRIN